MSAIGGIGIWRSRHPDGLPLGSGPPDFLARRLLETLGIGGSALTLKSSGNVETREPGLPSSEEPVAPPPEEDPLPNSKGMAPASAEPLRLSPAKVCPAHLLAHRRPLERSHLLGTSHLRISRGKSRPQTRCLLWLRAASMGAGIGGEKQVCPVVKGLCHAHECIAHWRATGAQIPGVGVSSWHFATTQNR